MKSKKLILISLLTFLCALPGIYAFDALALSDRYYDVKLLAIATLVFRLTAGVLGALLIFKFQKLGSCLIISMWSYMILLHGYSTYRMLTGPWQFEFTWNAQNQFYLPAIGQMILIIAIGITLIILSAKHWRESGRNFA